jgi:hypothetical protein
MTMFKLEPLYYKDSSKTYEETKQTLYVPKERIHCISFSDTLGDICNITLIGEIGYPVIISKERGLHILSILENE